MVFGDLVCALAEPTTVVCMDRATGTIRWSGTHDVVDTLPDEAAATLRPQLADAEALEVRLREAQTAYSKLRRAARAGSVTAEALEAAAAEMGAARAALDGLAPYRTPPIDPIIGWTSPTPVADDERLYVALANGVVAAWGPDGTRAWQRWLGPPPGDLQGYDGLSAASPRRIGDVVIVGQGDLVALDVTTGAIRWRVPTFRDFGTPAVGTVGGIDIVLTADGRMVRAADGTVLRRGLGDLWYAGPVLAGDLAVWSGSTSATGGGDPEGPWPTWARAWRLSADGDRVVATEAWTVQLPHRNRHYGPPLLWRDRLFQVASDGEATILDLETGARVTTADLGEAVAGEAWAGPLVFGDVLLQPFADGTSARLDPTTLAVTARHHVGPTLAAPIFHDGTVYLRTREAMWAFDTP